ncbi:MAG: protein kinase [Syntrophomonadaceae bacterium]|nr:protein kinase [Syntrophomonadaceae bacterium]
MNGKILGDRYELLEKVGDGGMAVVYKARCQVLDRIVAIKVLNTEYAKDNSFVEKFKTEAQAAARLSHPNIVNIFDVGQDNDVYYIVMEYVEGRTLKEIIREEAPLPIDTAVNIAIMICDGIHHAHERGIIHRDIKPHNILVTRDGIVKVADFGIAQAISKKTITYGGKILGSVHYISPEQARGEALTRATDIYSLGCVLYEMLTGKVPYDAESAITVALKHIHDDPIPPRSINENIPVEVENTVLKAMDKIPARRYSSAEYMRNALLGGSRGGRSFDHRSSRENNIIMPPLNDEGDEPRVAKRKLKPWVLTTIIAILGLALGVFFTMGGNLFGEEVEVPGVEGIQLAKAQQIMEDEGLYMDVAGKEYNDEYEADTVISQDPAKGEKVKTGRHISVVISQGSQKINVPSVVGMNLDDAEIKLRNANFNISNPERVYDDKYAEDFVISQYPKAYTRAAEGTEVRLMVSKGPEPDKLAMPDLVGSTMDEARTKLKDAKLILGEQKTQGSDQYFKNQIISHDPAAGVMVDEGTTINVVVSSGPGPKSKTRTLEFTLPGDEDYYKVVIIIHDAKQTRTVYNELHQGMDQVSTFITYYGKGTAEVQLNGETFDTVSL